MLLIRIILAPSVKIVLLFNFFHILSLLTDLLENEPQQISLQQAN